MTRQIKPLPPELTRLLFDAGPRKIVLVEGPDDRDALREWYMERLSEVEFYCTEAGMGDENVISLLEALRQQTSHAYGIIDRDFRGDAEVEAALGDPDGYLFILHRYAIENYLLEPDAPREELRLYYGRDHKAPSRTEMISSLLRLCRELRTIMAANWVFYEAGGIEHFREGHDVGDRALLIAQAAKRMACEEVEVEQRIAEKEALIDPKLAALETAHTCINGKHLLHRVYDVHVAKVKRGLRKDHFRNLLARAVKQLGIHEGIVAIVEQRILGERGAA